MPSAAFLPATSASRLPKKNNCNRNLFASGGAVYQQRTERARKERAQEQIIFYPICTKQARLGALPSLSAVVVNHPTPSPLIVLLGEVGGFDDNDGDDAADGNDDGNHAGGGYDNDDGNDAADGNDDSNHAVGGNDDKDGNNTADGDDDGNHAVGGDDNNDDDDAAGGNNDRSHVVGGNNDSDGDNTAGSDDAGNHDVGVGGPCHQVGVVV